MERPSKSTGDFALPASEATTVFEPISPLRGGFSTGVVHYLANAKAAPIVQARHRGRYPSAVVSMAHYLRTRALAASETAKFNPRISQTQFNPHAAPAQHFARAKGLPNPLKRAAEVGLCSLTAPTAKCTRDDWSFSREVLVAMALIDPSDRRHLENLMRATLRLNALT